MSWWGYKRKSVAPVTQPRTVARESECNNDRGGGQLEIRTRAELRGGGASGGTQVCRSGRETKRCDFSSSLRLKILNLFYILGSIVLLVVMGMLLVEDMMYPGDPNYAQIFPYDEERNVSYGGFHQLPAGECIMGEGDLVDPPLERFTEAADEDSDEDVDIEELERRMWRDRMRLKRLKEQQQSKTKEQGDAEKQCQSHEQARRKKMSRAQDGILKYMLKMMEVCKAQGFVYGIIPEKGKPVSGASDNLRAWWKEKVRFDRNGPAAVANGVTGAISFNSSEYDVEGIDESKTEDVTIYNLVADGNALKLGASSGNQMFGSALMKEENDVEFVQKRASSECELMMNQRTYTCDNVLCPHNDFRNGFLDRNSRNSHQYICKYQNTLPPGSGMTSCSIQVPENKPLAFPLQLNSESNHPSIGSSLNPVDISELGIPPDGQKSIDELMNFYDNSISGSKNMNLEGVTMLEGSNCRQPRIQMENNFLGQGSGIACNLFEEVGSLMEQSQYVQENTVPFEQELVSGGFMTGSGFNISEMNYSGTMHRGIRDSSQKQDGFNWFC
ncbi:hypothetical protein BHE74_00008569 [Ensete ventricosum]|nr:hypothetical protein GW17_00041347 [Ensete ventricosum]RWW82943.1 hypothetical protein BHE74_00008569 [Ensete ventricosum]